MGPPQTDVRWGTLSFGGVPGHRCAPVADFAVHVRRYAPHVDIRILEPTQRIVL
jgi:hypothetical protein